MHWKNSGLFTEQVCDEEDDDDYIISLLIYIFSTFVISSNTFLSGVVSLRQFEMVDIFK